MATRSTIAVQHIDGTVSSVYCHWDGYLEHNGKILLENYNTIEKVEELISLGDISSLRQSTECPVGHHFNNPLSGFTVFYGRDRGEYDTDPKRFENYVDYIKNNPSEEYNYIFINNVWQCEHNGTIFNVTDNLKNI